jgi:hypothetical protein
VDSKVIDGDRTRFMGNPDLAQGSKIPGYVINAFLRVEYAFSLAD